VRAPPGFHSADALRGKSPVSDQELAIFLGEDVVRNLKHGGVDVSELLDVGGESSCKRDAWQPSKKGDKKRKEDRIRARQSTFVGEARADKRCSCLAGDLHLWAKPPFATRTMKKRWKYGGGYGSRSGKEC
jgi:hypothetical protein